MTEEPGGLQSIGLQRVRDDWVTELNWTEETCMWVKKQHLEPDMEKKTGSKLGKEYNKAFYYHPDYLTYT